MTSSATDDVLPSAGPDLSSAGVPTPSRRWLVWPLILVCGLACGWIVPRWQTAETAAPDPFAALDDEADVFLGAAASPDSPDRSGAVFNAQPEDSIELPVLPGWKDQASATTGLLPADRPTQQWAAYETVAPVTADPSRSTSAPVWLDGTIELFAADDAPPRPLQQAYGPTSYQR